METETQTLTLGPSDPEDAAYGKVAALLVRGVPRYVLTREGLQQIVQAAYDQHGIAADPFATPGSAEAPEGPRIVEHRVGHVVHRTAEFTNAAHNTGARA